MRIALTLVVLLVLVGCDGGQREAGEPTMADLPGAAGSPLPAPPPPPGPEPMARLASKDCAEVVQLYLEAIGGREYSLAARVWDDPVIDAARLEAVFGGYREPQVEWAEPRLEGAAGTLYCTVSGKLSDAGDRAKPLAEGVLVLSRANDVPGATPDQLRWTLRSSTFVERLERSGRGET